MSRLRGYVPDWAVVVGIAGTVGATAAILSIIVYRDVKRNDGPVSVPSKSNDQTN